MIKARIDYATKSAKHPRFSKEMEFSDDKHLENFLAKASREGKKIIGHEVISDPCVYYLVADLWTYDGFPTPKFFREMGQKFTIRDFQDAFNKPEEFGEINQVTGYVFFDNIK